MPDYFQISLGATSWRPKTLEDLTHEVNRAFESDVKSDELHVLGSEGDQGREAPVSPTSGSVRLNDEESMLEDFCSVSDADISEQDSIASKALVLELPPRVLGELRHPKKVGLLSIGRQVAKYCGEVRGFNVDFALKLFDCGHFHIKETMGGSSAGLRGSIFEGRWQKSGGSGIRLEFLLRYPSQMVRRREASSTYEAVPLESRFAALDTKGEGKEEELEGKLPTCCSEEGTSWVMLRREAELPDRQARSRQIDDDDDDEELKALLRPPVKRAQPKKKSWEEDNDWDSDEPTWPMYLGIFLFIMIFCAFAYLWYEENYSPEVKKDFDEL